jgi:hypothetical protein
MDANGVLGLVIFFGIIVGIVVIRGYITKRGNEARAERERIAATNYLRATPVAPPAARAAPVTPAIDGRYAADDPPPPPPPGW